jgi:hypothetical protein
MLGLRLRKTAPCSQYKIVDVVAALTDYGISDNIYDPLTCCRVQK